MGQGRGGQDRPVVFLPFVRPHPSQSPALSELGHQLIQHRLHLSIQVGTNTDERKKGKSTRKGVKTTTGKQGDQTFITFGFARPAGLACLFGGECGVVNLGLRRDVPALLAPQVLKSEVLEPAGGGWGIPVRALHSHGAPSRPGAVPQGLRCLATTQCL